MIKNLLILFYISLIIPTQSSAMSIFKKDKQAYLETPISIPFDVSKKGNNIEFFMRPKETFTYRFSLLFYYYSPTKDPESEYYVHPIRRFFSTIGPISKYFKVERSKEERKEISKDARRVLKLIDGLEFIGRKPIQGTGISTLVRIKVIEIDNNQENIIYNKVHNKDKSYSGGSYRHASLTAEPVLTKGKTYKIIATSMQDVPELEEEKIHLRVLNNRPK